MARVANAKQVVHVSDLTLDEAYKQRDPGAIAGARSLVAVPMLKDDGSNNPDHRLTRAIPIARPMPLKRQYSLVMKGRDPRFAIESLAYQSQAQTTAM